MKVFACLWRGTDLPGFSANKYSALDVVRLRDSLERTNPGASLTIVADEHYAPLCEDVCDVARMGGFGCGGWSPVLEALHPQLWPEPGERHLLVGLDTLFLGDLTWLYEWDKAPVGIPLDPFYGDDGLPCDAVWSYDRNGAAIVWQAFLEARETQMQEFLLFNQPSEMMLARKLYAMHGWPPLEEKPEKLLSYKVHIRDQGRSFVGATLCYLHGKPKFAEMPESDPIRMLWEGSGQASILPQS